MYALLLLLFHVRHANQPAIMDVARCRKNVGHPWMRKVTAERNCRTAVGNNSVLYGKGVEWCYIEVSTDCGAATEILWVRDCLNSFTLYAPCISLQYVYEPTRCTEFL